MSCRAFCLDALRQKALQDIGPQPKLAQAAPKSLPAVDPNRLSAPQVQQPTRQPTASPAAQSPQSRGFDFDFGSGPVGPLFVGLALWMRRRKNRNP